ncbi:hypothetical protein NP493_514g00022 [Ridgeia piscesae]|uniref:Uncharacterized protein n=1 Tax=Ridgeia piscesae TaxID=27915 RepID=A0AAD9KWS3_RIDPI|nr:hypothetical protein NP493_514g00022 [Ridgeia piscesae]
MYMSLVFNGYEWLFFIHPDQCEQVYASSVVQINHVRHIITLSGTPCDVITRNSITLSVRWRHSITRSVIYSHPFSRWISKRHAVVHCGDIDSSQTTAIIVM